MKKVILILFVIMSCVLPAFAVDSKPQALTRGEVVKYLSTSDMVKKKIGELVSWTVGYDVSKVNRAKLTPIISFVKIVPGRVSPDGRTIVEITAAVDDPGGLENIAGVRADLSSIGRLPNTILVDSGMFGDKKAGDGLFTLQTTIPTDVSFGLKELPVAAANKKGWLALSKTTLDVENPTGR
ncbi:MAG: hypothetical protein WCT39_04835 [Candidatus Margulisiibacteriota bacterium]